MWAAAEVVILCTLISNVLYIQQPAGVNEMFICTNNDGNCTSSREWFSVTPVAAYLTVYRVMLPKDANQFKVRMIFQNETKGETVWKSLNECAENSTETTTNAVPSIPCTANEQDGDIRPITSMVYFILVCSVILVSNLVIEHVLKYVKNNYRGNIINF